MPEVRLVVAPVSAIWAAAPWTTVKEPRTPVVSPAAVASMTTGADEGARDGLRGDAARGRRGARPGHRARSGLLGEGDDGGAVAGDGVPGRVQERRGQDAGGARSEICGRAGERDLGGGAVDDGERAEGAGGEPGGGGLHDDRPDEGAGDRLGRDARRGGRRPGPADRACAGLLGEGDDGGAVAGDGVAGGVLDRGGQHPRRAGGEVGGRAGERDLGGGAVDDGEGAERAGGEPGRGRLHHDGADERAGDRLGRDAAGGGRGARAGDGAGAGLLGEGDDGGAVAR